MSNHVLSGLAVSLQTPVLQDLVDIKPLILPCEALSCIIQDLTLQVFHLRDELLQGVTFFLSLHNTNFAQIEQRVLGSIKFEISIAMSRRGKARFDNLATIDIIPRFFFSG